MSLPSEVALAKRAVSLLWDTCPLEYAPGSLSLTANMYARTSGLHNEGVWHNCIMGIVYHWLSEVEKPAEEYEEALRKLSTSLFENSFDTVEGALKQRVWTACWDHRPEIIEKLYKPHFWKASDEKKASSQSMAVIMYSFLRGSENGNRMYQAMTAKFLDLFLDGDVWISSTTRRHHRAVDQALCLLACLRMLKVHQEGDPIPADRLRDVIVSTRERILDTFGFASPRTALSYLENEEECGLRFVWQEIWVSFALLFSASLLDDPSQGYKQVSTLFRDLCTTYLDRTDKVPEGFLRAEPVSKGLSVDGSKIPAFAGDNALFYALLKSMKQLGVPMEEGAVDFEEHSRGFFKLVETVLSSERGLLYIADIHREEALWANSEFAFALLFQDADFVL